MIAALSLYFVLVYPLFSWLHDNPCALKWALGLAVRREDCAELAVTGRRRLAWSLAPVLSGGEPVSLQKDSAEVARAHANLKRNLGDGELRFRKKLLRARNPALGDDLTRRQSMARVEATHEMPHAQIY
jgi:hypothetical protein